MLREQGRGAGQQDASLQSLAVVRVWQGRPVYLHRFTSMSLSIHTLPVTCTALSPNLWQDWIAVLKVDRFCASIAAPVVVGFLPQTVPQVEDMPPANNRTSSILLFKSTAQSIVYDHLVQLLYFWSEILNSDVQKAHYWVSKYFYKALNSTEIKFLFCGEITFYIII